MTLTGIVLLALASIVQVEAAENNMRLHGALVAEPCVIPPGEENISLDFGVIVDKYLYQNVRTPGQPFEIRLAECDLALGKTVVATFRGTESLGLPGLLTIDAVSDAAGIAIGLETTDAKPVLLNKPGDKYRLQKGSNVIKLKAFVRGEPKAIAEKTIRRGAFRAVATFALEYE